MKLVKSLLLGSAAGLATVAGAQAADLPFRKAAPVDYVRVCDWVGQAGYFYIPGTDTCIKIGGEARYEYGYVQDKSAYSPTPFTALNFPGVAAVPVKASGGGTLGTFTPSRNRNVSGFLGRGQIEVDARTQTAYGLLRAFARLQGNVTGGNENVIFGTANNSATSLDKGYITFAGLTAGRQQSMFDFYADTFNYGGIANSDQSTEMLAYTATFGGGFSATISVENPNERRGSGIGTIAFNTAGVNGFVGGTTGLVGFAGSGTDAAFNGSTVGYAGVRYPDVVANIRYDQSWGAVQISGAYHDINTGTAAALNAPAAANTFLGASKAGWAVQGGIDVKLPMIAAGDELYLEGAYQEGAYLYQDAYTNMSSGGLLGGFQHLDVDAVAVGNGLGTGYRLDTGKGFSVMGAFHHYFTPQFHDVLFGSYEEIGYGATVRNTPWYAGGIGDASQWKIGNQFIFTPAAKLDIGLEVLYVKLDQDLAGAGVLNTSSATSFGAAGTTLTAADRLNEALGRPAGSSLSSYLHPDSFQVRLRINRDF